MVDKNVFKVNVESVEIEYDTIIDGSLTIDGYKIDTTGTVIGQVLAYDGYAYVPSNIQGIICSGSTPTASVAGSYTDATFVITGTDAAGLIQWNTGSNVGNPSLMFTITFAKAKINSPVVLLTSASLEASQISDWQLTFDQVSTTSFSPFAYDHSFIANTSYWFWYSVIGE